MAHHKVEFPRDMSYGTKGGPGLPVTIQELDSGEEERIPRYSSARRRYNVAYGVKSLDQLRTLLDFYLARDGSTHSFLYWDPSDFTTAPNHRLDLASPTCADYTTVPDAGDGSNRFFQIVKRYTSGPTTKVRNLTKPIDDTVLVGLNGVNQASGWTVDTNTGIITFTVAPTLGVQVTAGCQFNVPVRFGQFSEDTLYLSIDSYGDGSSQDIPLIEIKDSLTTPDDFFYGGAYETSILGSITLSVANGRVQIINCLAASLSATLPSLSGVVPGGPHLIIINDSTSNTLAIKDPGGTTLVTLTAGQMVEASVSVDGSNVKTWYVY